MWAYSPRFSQEQTSIQDRFSFFFASLRVLLLGSRRSALLSMTRPAGVNALAPPRGRVGSAQAQIEWRNSTSNSVTIIYYSQVSLTALLFLLHYCRALAPGLKNEYMCDVGYSNLDRSCLPKSILFWSMVCFSTSLFWKMNQGISWRTSFMFLEYQTRNPLVVEQYLKMSTMLVRFRIRFDAHWIQLHI